jgi:hypothetical protein
MLKRSWRTFAGFECEIIADKIQDFLYKGNYKYISNESEPTLIENLVFGSKKNTKLIKIEKPVEFLIRISDVSADPLFRGLYSFITSNENFSQMTRDICIIEIYPINKRSRLYIKNLIQNLIKKLPRKPWESLSKHPRFQMSPLLLIKTQKDWLKWEC